MIPSFTSDIPIIARVVPRFAGILFVTAASNARKRWNARAGNKDTSFARRVVNEETIGLSLTKKESKYDNDDNELVHRATVASAGAYCAKSLSREGQPGRYGPNLRALQYVVTFG